MLGKFERVEIRTVWSKEPEFSAWLGGEDGLKLLGEAMEIEELSLEGLGVSVGPYFADVVCMDVDDGNLVVIENQFEKSDHDHLGKLLTYASGLANTKAVVWIAGKIGDEHRAALEWLNERTNDRTGFFGFEIEVVKIGNSKPAPQLHPVAWPNEWVRDVAAAGHEPEIYKFHREYWTKLKEYMESNGRVQMRKPMKYSWMNFAIGKMFFKLGVVISTKKRYLRVQFYIKDNENFYPPSVAEHIKDNYSTLIREKLGQEVKFEPAEKGLSVRIFVQQENVDIRDMNNWNEQHEWFSKWIDKFDEIFQPIVQKIDVSQFPNPIAEINLDGDDGEE